MKTISELLELVNMAIENNEKYNKKQDVWFIDFSGHVNSIGVRYYRVFDHDLEPERCSGYLNKPDHVQELYYFIKNRL